MRTANALSTHAINRAVADGDLVMLHTTSAGTMKGDFAGMPASGKYASWDAVSSEYRPDSKRKDVSSASWSLR